MMPGSLIRKILLTVLMMVLLPIVALYVFLRFQEYGSKQLQSQANLDRFAHNMSAAIAPTLWQYDERTLELFAATISIDPDPIGFVVLDEKGKQVVSNEGPFGQNESRPLAASAPISFQINGRSHPLGTLTVSSRMQSPGQYFMSRLGGDSTLIGATLTLVALMTVIAVRRLVGVPLVHLNRSMVELRDRNLRLPVAWSSNDELGEVIVIYNQMLEEQRKSEVALQAKAAELLASQKRLQDTFDYMEIGCQIIGFDWRYLYLNHAVVRQSRLHREELLGHTMMEMYPGIEHSEVFGLLSRCMQERVSQHCENFFVFPDGTSGWFETKAQPLDEGIFITSNDITTRKNQEDEIKRLNASLEQRIQERTRELALANQELRAFSYSVSHDLRAPLRGIDGWSNALLEDYGDRLDEQARSYLERVRSETQRMGQLIDDMLSLSRVTQAELRAEAVDLSALSLGICESLAASDASRAVSFRVQPGLLAMGDRGLLGIALTNLLGNAWKFTAKRATAEVELGRQQQQGVAVYFVRDNGAGFEMEYAEKLFAPFQRLHSPREFPGSGIGLATVRRIIERHGGRIWVDAEAGRGATFFFTLWQEPADLPPLVVERSGREESSPAPATAI
jgi:PAS domain S-box-containing protein